MKRTLVACFAATLLAMVAGCLQRQVVDNQCPPGSAQIAPCALRNQACPPTGCSRCGGRHGRGQDQGAYQPGPPTGQVTYPYYTVRGPRDFLQRSPSPIGP
jgi:hypothetical protein